MMAALPPGQPLPSEATRSMVRQFMGSLLRNSDALICLAHLRERDRYLLEHALNCSILMTVFGRALQLPETDVEQLALAALWRGLRQRSQVSWERHDPDDRQASGPDELPRRSRSRLG